MQKFLDLVRRMMQLEGAGGRVLVSNTKWLVWDIGFCMSITTLFPTWTMAYETLKVLLSNISIRYLKLLAYSIVNLPSVVDR